MKKGLIVALIIVALTSIAFASPQTQTDLCLLRLTPYVNIVREAGLYPSVMLAQELLETGHCTSPAVKYNNFWGIKCKDDYCFSKETWEVYSGKYWKGKLLFQVFGSPSNAVHAYCRKILWQKEYQNIDYSSRNTFIRGLAKVWATDPDYASKIQNIIFRYNLTIYD